MKQIDLREGARRQHRAVAVYASLQCWLRGLDGVVFERPPLERFLGLEKFKKTRVQWLQEDLKDYFAYQKVYWTTGKKGADGELNSLSSLWVSRIDFLKSLPRGTLTATKRLALILPDGPKMALLKIWKRTTFAEIGKQPDALLPFLAGSVNIDERLLTSYLLLLSQGQISPQSMPSLCAVD